MTTNRIRLEGWKELGPWMGVSPRTARRLVHEHQDLRSLIRMGLNGQIKAWADEIDAWVGKHERTYTDYLAALEAASPRPGPMSGKPDPVGEPEPKAA